MKHWRNRYPLNISRPVVVFDAFRNFDSKGDMTTITYDGLNANEGGAMNKTTGIYLRRLSKASTSSVSTPVGPKKSQAVNRSFVVGLK